MFLNFSTRASTKSAPSNIISVSTTLRMEIFLLIYSIYIIIIVLIMPTYMTTLEISHSIFNPQSWHINVMLPRQSIIPKRFNLHKSFILILFW